MSFKNFYELIKEKTINDIKDRTDGVRTFNSKPVASYYKSINNRGTITFNSTAITGPERYGVDEWVQTIRPHEKPKKGMNLKEFRKVYDGDIDVQCNCPDFKWGGFEYIATKDDYKYGKIQTIRPDIRNPDLIGSTCKHLYNVLTVLKANLPEIRNDFNK